MKNLTSKRQIIDNDLGADREARQALLNAMVRAQSLVANGQLHTAMAILQSEMTKIKSMLNSKLK